MRAGHVLASHTQRQPHKYDWAEHAAHDCRPHCLEPDWRSSCCYRMAASRQGVSCSIRAIHVEAEYTELADSSEVGDL